MPYIISTLWFILFKVVIEYRGTGDTQINAFYQFSMATFKQEIKIRSHEFSPATFSLSIFFLVAVWGQFLIIYFGKKFFLSKVCLNG